MEERKNGGAEERRSGRTEEQKNGGAEDRAGSSGCAYPALPPPSSESRAEKKTGHLS